MSDSNIARLLPGFEVIDVHAHFGRWEYPGDAIDADGFRRLTDRVGFSKVVVSSARALMYDVPEGNAEIARLAESDERFHGSVIFNGHFYDQAREQIERYAEHPRFVCAKIHTAMNLAVNSPENLRVMELLAKKKLPLTMHTWTGDGPAAADAARRFPEVTFFWFHALASDYRKAAELAKPLPNVCLEFVTSTQERGKVEHLVRHFDADRMVFGTDQTLFSPIYALGPILDAKISDADWRKILSENAKRLLNFRKG
jgi:uncharacterized protein